jgi:hypothetical protein
MGIETTTNYKYDGVNSVYPVKRGIACTNLPATDKSYTINMASCSYDTYELSKDNSNVMKAIIKPCDEQSFTVDYSSYFDYNQLSDNIENDEMFYVNNLSRFIVEMNQVSTSGSGTTFTPKAVRELIYRDKVNTLDRSAHSIHIKEPLLIQMNATAMRKTGSYDEWLSEVSSSVTVNSLGIRYNNGGKAMSETMIATAPSDTTYNIVGFTACDETKTSGDLIGNVAAGSNFTTPTCSPIRLTPSTKPYVMVADERLYVNAKDNHLLQRARVIRLSDIYRLENATLSNISRAVDSNVGSLSFILKTNNTDTYNVLLDVDLKSFRIYDKLKKAYLPLDFGQSSYDSDDSGTDRVYDVSLMWDNTSSSNQHELHIITKSGITYAFGL